MIRKLGIAIALAFGLLGGVSSAVSQEAGLKAGESIEYTPPRLGYVDGDVSFWRPGAEDWAQAQVNTALAPGDQVYAASPGNLEIQIGPRAFVRGGTDTRIGLENQESEWIQFTVASGCASFDLRTLDPGYTLEVDTPNAVFTIERAGYYRVEVDGERTALIVRRNGQALAVPASGGSLRVFSDEKVVFEGIRDPRASSDAAPPMDAWDEWNHARTDWHLDAASARYVPPGTYGVSDLDRYGTWRAVPTYGSVWVPNAVPSGWVPYSTGAWVLDPYYGWTWVDSAPWGWAPFHHGRWVFVDGFWTWTPGPVAVRPVYAPACVAFFEGAGVNIAVRDEGPMVGWVALGWGEPLVPWWGRPGFKHRPYWGGWGGPRVVNNVVVHRTTVVHVDDIKSYRNASMHKGFVVVGEKRFGRGPLHAAHRAHVDPHNLRPVHSAAWVNATPASYAATDHRGKRPPERSLKRRTVVIRPPHTAPHRSDGPDRNDGSGGRTPERHVVPAPDKKLQARPQVIERAVSPKPNSMMRPEGKPGIRVKSDGRPTTQPQTRVPQRSVPSGYENPRSPGGNQERMEMRRASPQPQSRTEAVRARPAVPRTQVERLVRQKNQPRPNPGEQASRLHPSRSDSKPSQRKERPETLSGISRMNRVQ